MALRLSGILIAAMGMVSHLGCAAIPEVVHAPQYHNPFPQLHRVAVLPFFNLSAEPTVNQDEVAMAYFAELQQIPGFEVVPPGVVNQYILAHNLSLDGTTDFQRLARELGVDAVVRGAVTEFSPYYPPRMGITVDWIAANPSFHPIPPGYGLAWGTDDEKAIPADVVHEAEFALAKAQLETQTPEVPSDWDRDRGAVRPAQLEVGQAVGTGTSTLRGADAEPLDPDVAELPNTWPDPRGLIPPPPQLAKPEFLPQSEPVMSHTRMYAGNDGEFTQKLAQFYRLRDDARFGGWQSYLQRSDDFIRFCCHLHITEMLAARGGVGETRVLWRWPFSRYER